jgi:outer membrane protein OmpA-like peptidoglycan-associated protein
MDFCIMKKFMMCMAFIGLCSAANAQDCEFETSATADYKYTKVATNSFWANWFTQVGAGVGVAQKNPFSFGDAMDYGRTYGIALSVGKWFTPGYGMRITVDWEAFGGRDNVLLPNGLTYEISSGSKNYATVMYENLFNLSNLIYGYNENRFWNLSVVPRAGVARNFYLDTYTPAIGAGLQSMWRFSNEVGVYLEGSWNITTSAFFKNATGKYENGAEKFYNLQVGVCYNWGKNTWSKAVNLEDYEALSEEACAKLNDLRSQLQSEQDENARLREELAKKPVEVPAPAEPEKIICGNTVSTFFNINSAKLNSKKDLINLEAVATTAKNTGAKVVITGTADSKTGSSAYNQTLSENRAKAVAEELINLGVSKDKIETRGIGGVNDVTPYTLNRRAIVELK